MGTGATLVGRGRTAELYAEGEDRVLKLAYRGCEQVVEAEYRALLAVRAMGVPAPRAFGVVRRMGRTGVIMERVNGKSLLHEMWANPFALRGLTSTFARLHAEVHAHVAPPELPHVKAVLERAIRAADLPEDIKQASLFRLSKPVAKDHRPPVPAGLRAAGGGDPGACDGLASPHRDPAAGQWAGGGAGGASEAH